MSFGKSSFRETCPLFLLDELLDLSFSDVRVSFHFFIDCDGDKKGATIPMKRGHWFRTFSEDLAVKPSTNFSVMDNKTKLPNKKKNRRTKLLTTVNRKT